MCGICGIVSSDPRWKPDEESILHFRDSMIHRGPDDQGVFLDQGVGFGHRRLSIIDLSSGGHQPMSTPDERYHIIYNGEILNYKYLKAELEVQDVEFKTESDTEVLLRLFEKYNAAMLPKLIGMFAFAIWDRKNKQLFIARDRHGIKPLYYAVRDGFLYFASEAKALFAAGIPIRINQQMWEELLCFRHVAGENTPFEGVRRLLPGHYLIWEQGNLIFRRWWNLYEESKKYRSLSSQNLEKLYLETFEDAVRLQKISDVPIGVFLSGGLDSSSIAATLARSQSNRLFSFTIRFPYAKELFDEGPFAGKLAKKWNLEHHEILVTSDGLLPLLEEASRFNDEPFSQGDELFIYLLAKHAKPYVSVVLSGEGADETLGGYIRYQPLLYPALLNMIRPLLPWATNSFPMTNRLNKLAAFLRLGSNAKFELFNASSVLPAQLADLGVRHEGKFEYRESAFREALQYSSEPVRRAMYLDQQTFLQALLDRNDRMTMAASVECRVPFLDYRLVEMAGAMSSRNLFKYGKGKNILRQKMRSRLPQQLIKRNKMGFYVPWRALLRHDSSLHNTINSLTEMEEITCGFLHRDEIKRCVEDFWRGDNSLSQLILQLSLLKIWYQKWFGN